jgi:hypothetical protein
MILYEAEIIAPIETQYIGLHPGPRAVLIRGLF